MNKILLAATAIALFAGMSPVVQAQTPQAGTSAPGLPQAAPNFPAKGASDAPAASVTATPATTSAPAATTAPTGRRHAKRISLQQHFDTANTTHDGHLTRAQATAANWTYVTRHFEVMDSTHKGYVTLADIHAFGAAAHAARAQRKAAATPASTPATPVPGATAAPATTK